MIELDASKKRLIVISDIHSDIDALDRLLIQCGYNAREDQLVVEGDFFDRRDDICNPSAMVAKMKYLVEEGAIVLKGNHEEVFCLQVEREYSFYGSIFTTYEWFIENSPQQLKEVYGWIKARPLHIEIKFQNSNHIFMLAHAWPAMLELCDEKYLKTIRSEDYYINSFLWHIVTKEQFDKGFGHYHDSQIVAICGHSPTTLLRKKWYKEEDPDFSIMVNNNRDVFLIDGGLPFRGRLNGLIFTCRDGDLEYEEHFVYSTTRRY